MYVAVTRRGATKVCAVYDALIYGVAYHILPRFSGRQLFSDKLAFWQLWLANIGLVGMALGWYLRSESGNSTVLLIFSLVETVSIVFFAVNMLATVKPAPAPPAPAQEKK